MHNASHQVPAISEQTDGDLHDKLLYVVIMIGVYCIFCHAVGKSEWSAVKPEWVTVKWATAASFIAAGFLRLNLVYLKVKCHGLAAFIVTAMTIGWTGIGAPTAEEVETLHTRVPSIAATLLFALFIAAQVYRGTTKAGIKVVRNTGWFLIVAGIACLLGYAVDAPGLRFYIPEHSTAHGFLSAVAFICLGQSMRLKP